MCQSKKIHIEPCRGTEGDNDRYCQKDNLYNKMGEYTTQGKRTDLDELKKIIDEGGTLKNIADENFQAFIQYNRGFQEYKKLVDKSIRRHWREVKTTHIHG